DEQERQKDREKAPQSADALIEKSHVQRVSQTRGHAALASFIMMKRLPAGLSPASSAPIGAPRRRRPPPRSSRPPRRASPDLLPHPAFWLQVGRFEGTPAAPPGRPQPPPRWPR